MNLYKDVYEDTLAIYKTTTHFSSGPFDETFYSLRVFETAKRIIAGLDNPVDEQVILLAAIMHDAGKTDMEQSLFDRPAYLLDEQTKEKQKAAWKQHPVLSLSIAKSILEHHNVDASCIQKVLYLIEHHDKHDMDDISTELAIVQDADLIADIGIAGFIRGFLYAAKYGISVIEQIRYSTNNDFRLKDIDTLHLDISKTIAREQIDIQQKLYEQTAQLINSELLD